MKTAINIESNKWRYIVNHLYTNNWKIIEKYVGPDASIDADYIILKKEHNKIEMGWELLNGGELKTDTETLKLIKQLIGNEFEYGTPKVLTKKFKLFLRIYSYPTRFYRNKDKLMQNFFYFNKSTNEVKKENIRIIKFMLDYTESPFWAVDATTKSEFGYNIPLDKLELNEKTVDRLRMVTKLYYNQLNPIYQGFPSLWTGRMVLSFQYYLKKIFNEANEQLKSSYVVINTELKKMNNEIDVKAIDDRLSAFVNDPSKFADENGINYKSKELLKKEINDARMKWAKEELKWTTK